ncbi:MAG: N-acetylmuramoyl-L-alanine amidase [Pseudomonadota bacterium]
MRDIKSLIIHCAATRPDWMADASLGDKIAEIRRWHVDINGWRDIGYHYIIDRDGTRGTGRALDEIGAHTRGQNRASIGICLIGGHGSASTDAFQDHFTDAQELALLNLLAELEGRFGALDIRGHNDFAAKACPGFKVDRWLENEPAQRISLSQSTTIQSGVVIKAASVASPILGAAAGLPWQNLLILAALTLVILVASGIIDAERVKKWNRGDR